MHICGFADWDTKDLRINNYKFADLRFADWHTSECCGFVIAERAQEFEDLQKNFLRAHLSKHQDSSMIFRRLSFSEVYIVVLPSALLAKVWQL
jgi:hypothetical protein